MLQPGPVRDFEKETQQRTLRALQVWHRTARPSEAEWNRVLAIIADLQIAHRYYVAAMDEHLASAPESAGDITTLFPPTELQQWFFGEIKSALPEGSYQIFSRLIPVYFQPAISNLVAWQSTDRRTDP